MASFKHINDQDSDDVTQALKKCGVEVLVLPTMNRIEVYTNDWCNAYKLEPYAKGKKVRLVLIERFQCFR